MFNDNMRWHSQVTENTVSRGVVRDNLVVTCWTQIEASGYIHKTYQVRGKAFVFTDVLAGIPIVTSFISLDDAMKKYARFQKDPNRFYLQSEHIGLQFIEELPLDKTA